MVENHIKVRKYSTTKNRRSWKELFLTNAIHFVCKALINFNDNNKKKKADKLSKKGGSNSADGRDIVKIQVAAPLPGMDNTPMLLYNADRSAKTFIHDDKDDENRGYEKIKTLINTHGVSGALSGGGTKAYFYSHITRRQGEQDLVSIDISQLAAPQKW